MEILEGNGQHSLSWFRQRIGKLVVQMSDYL